MPSNLTTKIYSFVWKKDSMRSATITFDATAPDKWRFGGCKFTGVYEKLYCLDDWAFLRELAAEIERLCEENKV